VTLVIESSEGRMKMASKKRVVLLTMTLMIISLFVGCGNKTMSKIYTDDSKIASVSDTFGLDKSEETMESGIYKGKLKLSGSGIIWVYKSSTNFDLQVPYTLSVNSEKAKIVLISPDNTVGMLFKIIKRSPTVDESVLDSIPGAKRYFTTKGITFVIGSNTDVSFPKDNPEFKDFLKLSKDSSSVINTITSIN